MKKLLLVFIILLLAVLFVQAQKIQYQPYVFKTPGKSYADTSLPQILERKRMPTDSLHYRRSPYYHYKLPIAGAMPKQ